MVYAFIHGKQYWRRFLPVSPTEIDWSNPMTDVLLRLVRLTGPGSIDLVKGSTISPKFIEPTTGEAPFGQSSLYTGGNSGQWFNDNSLGVFSEFSSITMLRSTSTSPAQQVITDRDDSGSNGRIFNFSYYNNSGVNYTGFNSSAAASGFGFTLANAAWLETSTVGFAVQGSSVNVAVDGLVASGTMGVTQRTYNSGATADYCIGGRVINHSIAFIGHMGLHAFWGRFLPADELAAITEYPAQLLRVVKRRIYTFPTGPVVRALVFNNPDVLRVPVGQEKVYPKVTLDNNTLKVNGTGKPLILSNGIIRQAFNDENVVS